MARISLADFATDLGDDQRGPHFSGLLLEPDVDAREPSEPNHPKKRKKRSRR